MKPRYFNLNEPLRIRRMQQLLPFRARKIGGCWFLFDNDDRHRDDDYVIVHHIARAMTLKGVLDYIQRLPSD